MLLLYYTLQKNTKYQGIETYQVTNKGELKVKLKEYLAEYSGNDKVIIGVHDCIIDEETNTTLVDIVRRFVALPFVELFIVQPIKDYSELVETTNVHVVFKLTKKIYDYIEYYNNKGVRVHTIDDVSYFFYGMDANISK